MTQINNDIIERYKKVATATINSAMRASGYGDCFPRGVHCLTPNNQMMVGVAKTLRFIPPRPDIIKETHKGEASPEYEAMGSCKPGDVLVIDGMGKKYAAVGGDVKLLQLKMARAGGLVTDAAIRDLDIVKDYGFKIYASGRTPMGGADEIDPYEANVTIQCGGVAVRPGDLIVGDNDGVIVVPEALVTDVLEWAEEHEAVEEFIKELISKENVAPGKYYPITQKTIDLYRRSLK